MFDLFGLPVVFNVRRGRDVLRVPRSVATFEDWRAHNDYQLKLSKRSYRRHSSLESLFHQFLFLVGGNLQARIADVAPLLSSNVSFSD